MKPKCQNILLVAVLIYFALDYKNQNSTVHASNGDRSTPAASRDGSSETKVVGGVTVAGQAPRNHAINMAADPVCSQSHPGPATSEEFVVGPDNAVANVLVYISEGLAGRTFDAPKEPAVIEQKGCQYHSHVTAVQVGQKLLVENSDPTTHNIHPQPSNNREWNQSQAQGVPPIEATFGREEIAIPVKCNIHPWMKGYIAVFKHPYFALTGKDGKFVLKDLPPGNYTVTAWHEKYGVLSQKINLTPNQNQVIEFVFKP